ncbi:Redox-sensitive transcriptional activator SoxR [BD1-7 clade bacterium]|uniref:Redox-sensitive transcriptional activator SoxR n=1 Tax=BD1-7 clade bacterium TaxID=2029982 RepID=A0A5S9N3U6_9GAMM|nr:Redox-sensitive transcriptional activator SoxR [BD1-7 clade bacterium]
MDIADVVKQSGLPTSTLRYYESKGLIQSTGRHGLRRQYDASVLDHLALITLGTKAGFSLQEIGEMFHQTGPDIDRDKLSAKADELDLQIKKLTAMRNGLRHAAKCDAPSHMQCPNFLRMLNVANKTVQRTTNKLKP